MATATTMPEDFRALLQYADDVTAEPSPETAPYASHYRALEILQKWLTTPISPLETALANAKLGALYLHVEEPHNAQPALEKAARVFFPEILAYAATLQQADETKEWTKSEIDELLAKLPLVQIGDDREEYMANILELLNQLGVLWSNRAIPTRALCFFQACERFCTDQDEIAASSETATTSEEKEADNTDEDSATSSLLSLRDVRAHANFYLAQVYGSLNLPDASAQCCLATLELQLRGLLLLASLPPSEEDEDEAQDVEGVQDWIKNCLRLVDYYLAADNLKDAATCLSACEFLQSDVKSKCGKSDEEEENSAVQRAEIHLNWAKLHHLSLKIAQFRKEGYEPSPALLAGATTTTATMETTLAKAAARISAPFKSSNHYVPFDAITSFDVARQVFKMGMSACEGAKQVLVLDGFVTQHVHILQLESLFYKRLLHFETDLKRQIAMQLRRLNILSPLLQEQLNPDAYCALLQEVNYECAEIAAEVFDLKQEKKSSAADDKTTVYALKAINWYQQYLLLFYPSATTRREGESQQQQRQLPSGSAVQLPSTSMTANELRSVLLGYFGLARVCGRLQFPNQKEKTVLFWKQSLAYHQSVLELVKKFEQLGGTAGGEQAQANALHELFHAELNISKEMAELLPEKINQLVYNDRLL